MCEHKIKVFCVSHKRNEKSFSFTKKLAIYFKNLDNVSTSWTLPKKHKLVSYQEENYNKLVNKLS